MTALFSAASMLATGAFRNVLVVSADLTTRFIRPDDPKTTLVFGDGAAAALLQRPAEGSPSWSVLATRIGADGGGAGLFRVPVGGCVMPTPGDEPRDMTIEMNGRAIFRFGTDRGARLIDELCRAADLRHEDVTWVIPHQANLRIISALMERTRVPSERWVVNLGDYGNTASASVTLALCELMEQGRVESGDIVVLAAFGAGLTWSGLVLRAA